MTPNTKPDAEDVQEPLQGIEGPGNDDGTLARTISQMMVDERIGEMFYGSNFYIRPQG